MKGFDDLALISKIAKEHTVLIVGRCPVCGDDVEGPLIADCPSTHQERWTFLCVWCLYGEEYMIAKEILESEVWK